MQHPGMPHPGMQHPGMPHPGMPHPGMPHPGVPHPGLPLAALQQGGISNSNVNWSRNKSISEANLLSAEYSRSYHNLSPPIRDPRRNSVADFGHQHDVIDHG